jgi:transposase-like protein
MQAWSEEEARVQLAAFDRSGMSLTAWSARVGVSPQRVYYWRDRLSQRGEGARPLVGGEADLQFVEVAMRPVITGQIEVQWPSGHVLRVPVGVGVAEVLRAVGLHAC